MASSSDPSVIGKSFTHVGGFEGVLYTIAQKLTKNGMMNPIVGFLCQSVCPQSCIYPDDIQTPPTLQQCYDGLRGHRETQPMAVSILLHVLTLVGVENEDVESLKIVTNQENIEEADKEKFKTVDSGLKKSFALRELMFYIYEGLSQKERKVVINFHCRKLRPPRTYGYTECLLQHFIIMMQNRHIEIDKVEQLDISLQILGRSDLLELIDTYCRDQEIPRPRSRVARICARPIDFPVQATPDDDPRLDAHEPTEGRDMRPIAANVEPTSAPSVVAEDDFHAKTSEETGKGKGAMVAPENKPFLHLPEETQGGARGQEMTMDAEKDASVHDRRPANKIEEGEPELVTFSEVNRLSREVAYVKWAPVTLDRDQPIEYRVHFESTTTREEGEGGGNNGREPKVITESTEFSALKLEGDKEYRITVSVVSPTGTILARGLQSIPLPREEPVPPPKGIKLTPLNSTSLRVQWKRAPASTNAIGYTVFYSPSADSPIPGQQKAVNGVNTTQTTLKELQPNLEYSVRVVLQMPEDVIGPSSKLERGKPQRMRGRCAALIGLYLSISCVALVFLLLVVNSGVLGGYSVSRLEDRSFNITQGDTIDLGNYDRFLYDVMSISTELISSVTVYLHETLCTDLQVHRNTSYGYENMMVPIAETAGVNPANGYFAHGSEPTFQLNATGPMSLTNCSAAFYLFDNPYYYDQFRFYGRTAHKVHDICFDVFDNDSKLTNEPMSYHIERSKYLYIGIFLTGVTNASLRIAGTQNVYNHTDFANYSTCVIDDNTPDCSFPLDPILRVDPSKPTSSKLCALAYWKPSTGSGSRQNINTTATYDIESSFPHNVAQLLSLIFVCVFSVLLVVGIVALFLFAVYLRR